MVKVRGRAWAAKRGLLKPESRTPGQIDGAFFGPSWKFQVSMICACLSR